MHFYSIHVIAEYNLSGSEIICRQIYLILKPNCQCKIMLNRVWHILLLFTAHDNNESPARTECTDEYPEIQGRIRGLYGTYVEEGGSVF